MTTVVYYDKASQKTKQLKAAGTFKRWMIDRLPNVAEVDIGPEVTAIGNNAFAGCLSLEKVKMTGSAVSAETCAFSDCISPLT